MNKTHKTINWAALLTAIATAIGSYFHYQYNSNDSDIIKNGVAAEFAVYKEWKRATIQDVENMQQELKLLRDTVASLKATVSYLTRASEQSNRDWKTWRELQRLDGLLESLDKTAKPSPAKILPKPASRDRIEAQRAKLFGPPETLDE